VEVAVAVSQRRTESVIKAQKQEHNLKKSKNGRKNKLERLMKGDEIIIMLSLNTVSWFLSSG